MNNKKITIITIGVIVFYLCLLMAWHFYDPSGGLTEFHPGADHRPAGHIRKADDVLIGEFFMQDASTQVSSKGKGEWPCFRGIHHDNQTTKSPEMKWIEGDFEAATAAEG